MLYLVENHINDGVHVMMFVDDYDLHDYITAQCFMDEHQSAELNEQQLFQKCFENYASQTSYCKVMDENEATAAAINWSDDDITNPDLIDRMQADINEHMTIFADDDKE